MTAATDRAPANEASRTRGTLLMGFDQFFRKELAEWWASRRAVIVFVVTSLLVAGTTVAPWLQATFPASDGAAPTTPIVLDPTINLLGANWHQWLTFIPILAAMGLMASERDRGTLAWSLSKPLSRTAVLLAKWSAATLVYAVAGVLLPMVVGSLVATLAYGAPPDVAAITTFTLAILALPAFYIALCLAVGTLTSSQAAVAGVAVAVSFLPAVVGLLSSTLGQAMPPAMGGWALALATGASPGIVAPVGWAIGMVILAVAARVSFERTEL